MRLPRLSLLLKIWLSTAVAVTALYAITGWLLQQQTISAANESLQEEVRASFGLTTRYGDRALIPWHR